LVAEGRSVGLASTLIARSTLIAAPTVAVSTYLYSVWSTKSSLILAIGITSLGLLAILLRGSGALPFLASPIMPLSLLIVGSSGMISILLPYAAENYPIRIRGRATGWVAGWSKIGGLIAQGLSALALVPALGIAAAIVAIPAALSMVLIWVYGHETRGRDLRELEIGAGAPADALP
jgi:putative MFS transporter